MTHIRRRHLSLTLAVAGAAILTVTGGRAQVGDRSAVDTSSPPADWKIPSAPVRSPEDSIRLMEVAPGFRVEPVAAEPLVQDPIAMAFDRRGRLWVLEWPTYNWELRPVFNLPPDPPPASRVVVLDDTTGDGRMDRRTVFAEINWPRGLLPLDDGVLVFALPEIVFLRDTNGDGRADRREVVVSGLPIPANPHSAPSSPLLAMDNWIYALRVDHRIRRRGGTWDVEPAGELPGQWGLSQDDSGRLYFSYNQDAIRGSLVPPHYARRNLNYDADAGLDERVGLDNTVWPHAVTPGVNRRAQLRDDGRLRVFTANAAPLVYRADHFGGEFRGNIFVVEAAGRLIRRFVPAEEAGVVTARNAYDEREFLFSRDERFRPVFTATGPDGALYVADMYRGIIEGHLFVTTFLRNQILDRRLHEPFHGRGRIYRIVQEGRPASVQPNAAAGDAQRWVAHLGHPSGYWRDLAQRSIIASGSQAVVPAVRRVAEEHADRRARLHALWTLEGLGAADASVVRARLRDPSPAVRMAALRLAEPLLHDSDVFRAVLAVEDDPEPAVRRQLVHTLGATRAADALDTIVRVLERDAGRPFVGDAALSGLAGREADVLARMLAAPAWREDRPDGRALIAALTTAIVNEGRGDRIDPLVGIVTDEQASTWRRLAVLQGIDAARRPDGQPPPTWVARLGEVGTPEVRARALKVAARWTAASRRSAAAGLDAATTALVETGRAAYAVCAACHQPDGRGLPAMAPTLAGAAVVAGPADALIDVVLQGRDADPAYPAMSPLAGLPDDQIAAILTYIRQAWGNASPPVTSEAVRARRPR
jgi:putative membrane-bound dehydrogenase-like protein